MQEKIKEGRQRGRSARKRMRKDVEKQAVAVNGEEFRKRLQQLPAEEAVRLVRGLWDGKRQAIVGKYDADLKRIGATLHNDGVWVYFEENRQEAAKWGLEGTLRELVLDAAGRFADGRMLRLVVEHKPR